MSQFRFILLIISLIICQIQAAYFNSTIEGVFHSMDTECPNISTLKVPGKVNKCTMETFVYYLCKNIEKSGFLTKNLDIISETNFIECQDNLTDSIETGLFTIQKIGNNVLVKIKNKSLFYAIEFLKNFFNDTNDYCYIALICVLIFIFIIMFAWFKYILNKKILNESCNNSINNVKSVIGGYKNKNNSQSVIIEKNNIKNVNNKKKRNNKSVKVVIDISCGCTKGCISSNYCVCLRNNQKCSPNCHGGELKNCCNK